MNSNLSKNTLKPIESINKWKKENSASFFQAIVFPDLAVITNDLPEMLGSIKERKIAGLKLDPPHLPTWFNLYRSHSLVDFRFYEFLGQFSEYGKELYSLGVGMQELSRQLKLNPNLYSSITQENFQEAHNFLQNLHSLSQVNMKETLSDIAYDEVSTEKGRRYWQEHKTELSFMFLVVFPCYLLYKTSPTKLYHKARTGNIDAIRKLLQLDSLILHDPFIGKAVQKLRFDIGDVFFKNLIKSALAPFPKMTKKRAKFLMSGLISFMAQEMKQSLEEPQIRSLYDSIEQDRTGDKYAIDLTLPDAPESFSKEIQRYKSKWHPLIDPDKTI